MYYFIATAMLVASVIVLLGLLGRGADADAKTPKVEEL